MSTSLNPNLNVFVYLPIELKIQAKKNTLGYVTDNFVESECILPRETTLNIIKLFMDKQREKVIIMATIKGK